jgi:hypothetical protein
MPCRPDHVNLEVDPSATEKIVISLDKTCDANDQAIWQMSFELQEGNPLATVVKLDVEIDPENHPQAEATATSNGLDDNQQGQAKIAAAVAKDPTVEDDDKKDAAQEVIAVRQLPAMAAVTAAAVPTATVPTAPVPTAPVPTAPVTTAPVPTAPVPTAPVPTAPVPTAPVTTAPVPTAPVPTAPVTTAPVNPD